MGRTSDPAAALANADIFFYPLQRDHYGTAENALVEAMSLGLAPLVLDNPAEKAIVQDGKTGFVASSIEEIGSLLEMLLLLPDVREKISRNAIRAMAETRTPAMSAQDFMILWLAMLAEPACVCDFASAIGSTPAEWFLSTQQVPGAVWTSQKAGDCPSRRKARSLISRVPSQIVCATEKIRRLNQYGPDREVRPVLNSRRFRTLQNAQRNERLFRIAAPPRQAAARTSMHL